MSPPADPPRRESGKVLVAGIGNIFLGDDGFGVETVRALAGRQLPPHVEAVDIGVRGVHLAYQVLDGYDTLILVDATARGERPGTLYVIEHDSADAGEPHGVALDGHRMTPDTVLALLGPSAPPPAGSRRAARWSWDANPSPSRRESGSARRCRPPCRRPSG